MKWPFILALCALFFLLAVLFTLSTTSEEEIAFAKQEPEVTAQSTEISSNAPLVLTDEIEEYQLGLHLEILEDPSTQLTFDQVSSPEYDSQFKPSQVNVPNYGYTASAYWVRATLDNETSWVNEWLLEVGFANTHYVDLYYPSPDGDGYVSKQSGVLRPLSTRDVIYPKIVFDLTLLPQTQGTVYLRFQSGASMTIPLTLWTKDAFIGKSGQELILHWLLFGGFVALLIYHLFLLITLRELTYLYFVAMLVSMLMVLLEYLGYMGVYIFPDLHNYKLMYGPFLLALMNVSILLFSDNFLELSVRSPISHWVTVGFLVIWLLLIILIPVVSYLVIARLMIPTQLITIMATWVIGIVSWRRDFKSLRYFMVAWLGMAASLFWLSLVRLGIASSTNFSENMFQWGFIVMAVSWSFALAYRINLLKTTTENTARDLQKSERRLSQILEGLPVGVVVYGKDQKPAFINRWTVEMLSDPTQGIRPDISAGRTLEQAIDQFSFQVAGTEDKYPLEGMPVYRALHGEPASADDIAVNIKDGQVLLEVWASPIKDGEGKVESAVATIQDITSRKQVEAELEEHRRQLETLVWERTVEIDKINRDLQLRLDWLSLINNVHQKITGSTSITQVYSDLSTEVLSLLEADLVVILRWDGQNDNLEVVANLAKGTETLDENILYKSFKKSSPLRNEIETFTPIRWP